MPNTRSAIKAARQNIKRREVNLAVLEKIKKTTKSYKKALTTGKLEDAKKNLSSVFAALDKAAKKNIIHKNNASRHKARLSKMLAKASAK